ncbi:MAG: hypothetical protein Q9174_004398 [Haloplaca sp. 1 TL-2023]
MAEAKQSRSPSSDEPSEDSSKTGNDNARNPGRKGERSEDDEEKAQNDGPPPAVGFFDKGLNKVRLEVFKLWGRTTNPFAYRSF